MSTRRLAAIMFTDIAGYTAMMQEDEARAIALRTRHREVFEQEHAHHRGTIVQYYGDGTLSVFESAIDAAACAVAMQRAFQQEPKVPLRIGIHTGDILLSETEVIGDGVNVASRVESMAVPGSVLVSETVYDNLKNQAEFQGNSLGIFTFKNVSKPIEVFALASEGLAQPNPKKLGGKYLKRQSATPNFFQRLPIWAQYSIGLVAFLLLAPIIYSPITSLFDAQAVNTVIGPNGETITRDAVAFDAKKRFLVTDFSFPEADSSLEWAKIVLPLTLSMDWEQDPYIYDIYEPFQPARTLKEYAEKAKEARCDWIVQGNIAYIDSAYEIGIELTNRTDFSSSQSLTFSGEKLLPLLDEVSLGVKKALGVPEAHLRQVTDLPIAQFLTSSEEALKAFGIAYATIPQNPIQGFYLMKGPLNEDSTYAWAAYNLAQFIKAYQLSETKAKEYIDLAMRHRGRLPDVFELRVRQLYYRLNGEPDKALELTRLFVNLEPDNPKHLKSLIEESFMQGDYQATLEAIATYRELDGQGVAYLTQKAQCLLALDRPKDALEAIDTYLAGNPNQEAGMIVKAEVLIALEKWEDAAKLLSQAELLFPETPAFASLALHVKAAQEGTLISREQKEALVGIYTPFLQSSYRSPIRLQSELLMLALPDIPPIHLYHTGEGLNFHSVADQRVEFQADSTGRIVGMTFFNDKFGIRQQQFLLDDSTQVFIDGLFARDYEKVNAYLPVIQKRFSNWGYFKELEKHLAWQKAGGTLDSAIYASYAGRYINGQQVLIVKYEAGSLTLNQSAVEWADDPLVLLYKDETTFLFDESYYYQLVFKRKGGTVSGISLDFIDMDRSVDFTRMAE